MRGQPIGTHFDDPQAPRKGVIMESLGQPPSRRQGSEDTVKPRCNKFSCKCPPTVLLGKAQEGSHEWAFRGWGWVRGQEQNGPPLCTFHVLVTSFLPCLIPHTDCKVGIRVPAISSEETEAWGLKIIIQGIQLICGRAKMKMQICWIPKPVFFPTVAQCRKC